MTEPPGHISQFDVFGSSEPHPAKVERFAKIIASGLLAQNHMLAISDDGVWVYDDYDNKSYDCRLIAEAIIGATNEH